MTLDEAIELGRAWPSWKRAKGQVGFLGSTSVVIRWADTERIGFDSDVSAGVCDADRFVPDLRDPGTRGHALEQVREAWGDYDAYVSSDCDVSRALGGSGWTCWVGGDGELCEGPTEAAALLAARMAAPRAVAPPPPQR